MKRIFTSFLLIAVAFISSTVFAAEPIYGIPQGDRNQRIKDGSPRYSERLIHSFSLSGTTVNGTPQPFTSTINQRGNSQREVYIDRTNETVELTAGDEVSIQLEHDIIWMHSYLYIDYDHDGVFNEDNELVSYSFYSASDSQRGVNSKGETVLNNINPSLIPGFTVDPNAKSVTTRMRLKIDWNSKDPIGNPTQSIGGNAGSIVDFTVKIHGEEVVAKVPVTLLNAENGTFEVLNEAGEKINNGQEVAVGTKLKVSATPNNGYRVKDILVNGKPVQEGVLFVVEEATSIQVSFEKDVQMWTVTFSATEGGSITVLDGSGVPMQSGDKIEDGLTIAGCKFIAEQGYTLTSVLVNDIEMIDLCMYTPFGYMLELTNPIKSDLNIQAVFKSESAAEQYAVTWDVPSNGTVQVLDAKGQELYNGQEVEEGSVLTVNATPAEGFRLKEILVNGSAVNSGAEFTVTEATNITVTFEADVPMRKISITANEGGSFMVLTESGEEIRDGQQVPEGTMLKVVATPLDGYAIKAILVNGARVDNNSSFAVLRATTIEVQFMVADKWNVNIETTEGGTVVVLDIEGNPIENGTQIKNGTILAGCKIMPAKGYTLASVKINDIEKINECLPLPNGAFMLELNDPVLGDMNIAVTFTAETGIGEVVLAEAAYNAGAKSLNIPAGAYAVVYNTAGQQVMNVQGGQMVSTASLADGIYVARVVAEGGVKVIKFVQK